MHIICKNIWHSALPLSGAKLVTVLTLVRPGTYQLLGLYISPYSALPLSCACAGSPTTLPLSSAWLFTDYYFAFKQSISSIFSALPLSSTKFHTVLP